MGWKPERWTEYDEHLNKKGHRMTEEQLERANDLKDAMVEIDHIKGTLMTHRQKGEYADVQAAVHALARISPKEASSIISMLIAELDNKRSELNVQFTAI
jgi:hypothetical protein